MSYCTNEECNDGKVIEHETREEYDFENGIRLTTTYEIEREVLCPVCQGDPDGYQEKLRQKNLIVARYGEFTNHIADYWVRS